MAVKFARNEHLSITQLQAENVKLQKKHAVLSQEVRRLDRKAVGFLWLLWFIPIIGWVIYSIVYARRRQSPAFLKVMLPVKEELAMNEFQTMQNNVWIEKKQAQAAVKSVD